MPRRVQVFDPWKNYAKALERHGLETVTLEITARELTILVTSLNVALRCRNHPPSTKAYVMAWITMVAHTLGTVDPLFEELMRTGMPPTLCVLCGEEEGESHASP